MTNPDLAAVSRAARVALDAAARAYHAAASAAYYAARDALDAAADDHAAASDDLIAALATMAALNDAEEGDALDDAETEDEGGDA
jgi:hypothetical protein